MKGDSHLRYVAGKRGKRSKRRRSRAYRLEHPGETVILEERLMGDRDPPLPIDKHPSLISRLHLIGLISEHGGSQHQHVNHAVNILPCCRIEPPLPSPPVLS